MVWGARLKAAGSALLGRDAGGVGPDIRQPRAQAAGGMTFDNLQDPRVAEYLRGGILTASGAAISERTPLYNAVAWRCATIRSGVLASLPWDLMIREGEQQRSPAVNHPFREVLTLRPNNRQTPGEFKRMLQLHRLQCGDGFAMKIKSLGRIIALWPLDPTRMQVIENQDASLTYRYSRKFGGTVDFEAADILHVRGLSWDGVRGLPVIRYMAEAIGMGLQTQKAAAKLFKNGHFTPGYFQTDKPLSDNAYDRLKADIDARGGVDSAAAGKVLILEEGLQFEAGSLSATDAQLIELMGFTRTDIGMFYGVPPFLYGDTEKSTSWGTGIEQQKLGFLDFTVDDDVTAWREAIKRDCLSEPGDDPRLYVHVDYKGFMRTDSATRSAYLSRALGAGGAPPWMTQNEARAAEDMPPRPEAWANELPKTGSGKPVETANDNPSPAKS